MRVVFMGTPEFAVPVLQTLIDKYDVVCVYTQPPRPAGRGHKMTPSPVQQLAEKHGIMVRYPVSLKSESEQVLFQMLDADVAVVCAYGLLLPSGILNAFPMGCINVHASLLPRWRGAAPIQRAIMAGDKETGITIMQMEKGLDTGDILMTQSVPITSTTTYGELHDKLASIGAKLIVKVLDNRPTPTHQPFQGVTYAEKIQKEESLIDWHMPADLLNAKIRALTPYPKAYFMLNGERITVLATTVKGHRTDEGFKPGTVLDNQLTILCGLGSTLQLDVLQRPGKNPVKREDFLRGFPIKEGTEL